MEEEKIVKEAFENCMKRGWLQDLIPSTITNQEIADFEEKYQVKLPSLYKAFLTSYQLPCDMYDICGIISQGEEITIAWLNLYGVSTIASLLENINNFREDAIEWREATLESCRMLIPIGDWGAGWGPLCMDLSKDEDLIDQEDESTWSLVWFDHEEFNWSEDYLGEDDLLHGRPAAPSLKVLLDWYFSGSLEPDFEEENDVKLNYERLSNMEFCCSYWEDKWKERRK